MRIEKIRWPAPAKLNLFLYITGQRSDGYHNLQTLFQFIDRCDFLTINANRSGEITISPEIAGVPLKSNLIYKAARLLKKHSNCPLGAHIELEKNLPMGGGLGGGSSDAATTLVALNYHWQLNLSKQTLAELGVSLGADIPIFIHGKAAIAEGVGEKLTSVNPPQPYYLVAMPSCHISTPAVFKNPSLKRDTKKLSHEQLMSNKWTNDCQPCVKKEYPEVAKTIDWLLEYAPTQMTGTGACVFSTFEHADDAELLAKKSPNWLNCFTTKGVNISPLRELLTTKLD
ncbi:4-(cytidine 5'-diphospho)-2-C-methyl-D-erythritol kinase [Psychromonas sp. B3M02]|uniref:4-(cytidine 5'-diphospho)-2-C-methyl-D-erythritol kinase n=1 Tax=Psychromonas sp. B3M02 TaxID=2267226 RepID=UPI000DE96BA3|nr:4-(cytidine 5'-diphospho)-2-C-methyl-D-erythritol kinase [Psychromonas sp. B3M02]RBW42703.1 4-(cytidine 5'-diphospho)-2-C-methyl-D-erythritol kinase [Psychromonas sp. B3M02]